METNPKLTPVASATEWKVNFKIPKTESYTVMKKKKSLLHVSLWMNHVDYNTEQEKLDKNSSTNA